VKFLLCLLLLPLATISPDTASAEDGDVSARPAGTASDPVLWYWLNPRPTSTNLEDVVYASPTTAFAVGRGTIIRSTDGGYTWENLLCPTRTILRSVSFVDEMVGVVVGDGGMILRTDDGAETWSQQTSGTTVNLWGVSFTDSTTGTAVGSDGTILRTTDGGSTWGPRSSGTGAYLTDVDFIDARTGVVVGIGETILRTDDGGVTWSPQSNDPDRNNLYGVDLVDSLTCWAAGHFMNPDPDPELINMGCVIRTTDAGATWSRVIELRERILTSVQFGDSLVGAAVGLDTAHLPHAWGDIVKTFDGGNRWSRYKSGALHAVAFDGLTSCTVGEEGYIEFTTDGYRSHEVRTETFLPAISILRDVCFTDMRKGVVVGQSHDVYRRGLIYRTLDGGRTWQDRSYTSAGILRDVDFVGPLHGWAAGSSLLMRTSDGGDTWWPVDIPVDGFTAVSFVDTARGWAAGHDGAGVILRTADGGQSWTVVYHDQASIDDICFANPRRGWAVYGDVVYRTFDGGDSWTRTRPEVDVTLHAVSFADSASGAVVGRDGRIFWTADGGDTWTPQASGTTDHLRDISLSDDSVAIATGNNGTILVTTDAGATWVRQYSSTKFTLWGADATGRVVGHNGTILSMTPPEPPPPPPLPQVTRFVAVTDFDNVWLQWQIQYPDSVLGFRVLRQSASAGDVWLPADSLLGPSARLYDDYGVNPGNDYTYTLVVPLTSGGEVRSDPLLVSTPVVPAIAEFRATPEPHLMRLFWQVAPLDGVSGYRLIRERSDAAAVWKPDDNEIRPSIQNYVDRGLEPDVAYTYTLVVYLESNAYGGEVRSDPLVVTTGAVPAITAFEARPGTDHVLLEWEVDTDEGLRGFTLRKESGGYFDAWIPEDSLLASSVRSFDDIELEPGYDYAYTLVALLESGGDVRTPTLFVTTESVLPRSYALGQNFPNPFNPETEIPYALPAAAQVTLEVFDTTGRRVRVLVDEHQEPGYRSAPWDGLNDARTPVASGVYFYRLQAGGFTETRKMVLLK